MTEHLTDSDARWAAHWKTKLAEIARTEEREDFAQGVFAMLHTAFATTAAMVGPERTLAWLDGMATMLRETPADEPETRH